MTEIDRTEPPIKNRDKLIKLFQKFEEWYWVVDNIAVKDLSMLELDIVPIQIAGKKWFEKKVKVTQLPWMLWGCNIFVDSTLDKKVYIHVTDFADIKGTHLTFKELSFKDFIHPNE